MVLAVVAWSPTVSTVLLDARSVAPPLDAETAQQPWASDQCDRPSTATELALLAGIKPILGVRPGGLDANRSASLSFLRAAAMSLRQSPLKTMYDKTIQAA